MSLRGLGLFAYSLLFVCVAGLYEDQAGIFDWQQHYVGKVSRAFFLKGNRHVLVATEQQVIASLDLSSGGIVWRKLLAPEDTIDDLLVIERQSIAVSLSSQGKFLRAWNTRDGMLEWQAKISGIPSKSNCKKLLYIKEKDIGYIGVWTGNELQAR